MIEQRNKKITMETRKKIKCEIYRDSMQNYKKYAIPPAQLIIADVPYEVKKNDKRRIKYHFRKS